MSLENQGCTIVTVAVDCWIYTTAGPIVADGTSG